MRYIKEVLLKNRALVLAYVGLGIFNAFMANYKANYFQRIIDGLADGTLCPGGIALYACILLVHYVMGYVDNYPEKRLEHGIYLDFKLLALRKISTIAYIEYQKIGTGKLVQRIESGAGAGRAVLFSFWLRLVREILPTVLFSISFIWRINRTITYALLVGYVFLFITANILLRLLYRIKERILNHEELLNHYLVRGFMEMPVFRMNRQFPGELRKAAGAKEGIVSSKVRMTLIHEAFFTIFVLLVAMLDIGIIFYAWHSKTLSVGAVAALVALIENAYMPIAILNVIYVQYKLDIASFARFEDFLRLEEDERLTSGRALLGPAGEIAVDRLSFQYDGRGGILSNLSLSVRRGESVALVGESGSGKSTFVKLLVGLLKYERGSVTLGGMELRDIRLNDLYGRVSYLSQDTPVFDGTIRENLVFDRGVPDGQLLEALDAVLLPRLAEGGPAGLDTEIGERGACLSGEERQRLALARLWLSEAELVVLDEATSAIDSLTEGAVMGALLHRLEGRTVVAIAHRLQSIAGFDRIVVFRGGKIVNEGTFEELIDKDAYFAELYRASARQ